jgi:hypothetical protein
MKTTINGQLLLTMLAESLSGIPDSKLVMMNTDGLEIRLPRKSEEEFTNRCKLWEEYTSLKLEHAEYSKMVIADVNNYVGVFAPKKAKSEEEWLKLKKDEPNYVFLEDMWYQPTKVKGRFELKLDLHKNPSGMIITQAVFDYFVRDTPAQDTINGCENIFEFCMGVKKKADFELLLCLVRDGVAVEEKQQKVCRYYASSSGGRLMKDYGEQMVPIIDRKTKEVVGHKLQRRMVSVEASTLVTPANRIDNQAIPADLDRNYYISEANKEIRSVIGSNQTALF